MKYEDNSSKNKKKVMINVKVFGRQWAQERRAVCGKVTGVTHTFRAKNGPIKLFG